MGATPAAGPIDTATRPFETIHGARAGILVATLILGVLSYQLNASMLSPALPDMAKSLNTSVEAVSNVSSTFFLAGAVGGILFTRWSDFIGRRRGLLIVLVALMLGTVLCIFAPNLQVLLIGRILQGASNATYNFAYLILAERLSAKKFGIAIGAVSAANGGVGGLDGLLGGYLSDSFGYRAIFIVIFAVGVVAALLAISIVPKDRPFSTGRMDWWGLAVLSIGLICFSEAISTASGAGVTSALFILYVLGAITAFVAFWFIEKASKTNALVQPKHLKSRRTWPLLATTILSLAGVYSFTTFSVVLLAEDAQAGFGLNATVTGLLFLVPPAIIGAICAPLVGWIANRTDWVWTLRVGMFACVAILIALSVFTFDKWAVFALTALTGIALNAMVFTTLNGLSVLLAPKDAPAVLSGLNGASFGIGAALGIALVAPFVALGTHAGYTTSLLISIGVAALAAIATLLLRRPETSSPASEGTPAGATV